jgi:hypothetical protein
MQVYRVSALFRQDMRMVRSTKVQSIWGWSPEPALQNRENAAQVGIKAGALQLGPRKRVVLATEFTVFIMNDYQGYLL